MGLGSIDSPDLSLEYPGISYSVLLQIVEFLNAYKYIRIYIYIHDLHPPGKVMLGRAKLEGIYQVLLRLALGLFWRN